MEKSVQFLLLLKCVVSLCVQTQEHSEPGFGLPARDHGQNACQLEHEETGVVKEVGSVRTKEIHRPHINEEGLFGIDDGLLAQLIEMSAQADILLHFQGIRNQLHIFQRT